MSKHQVYEVNSFVTRRGEGVEEVACSCAGDFTFGMDKERGEEKKREKREEKKIGRGVTGKICALHISCMHVLTLYLGKKIDCHTLKSGCGKTSRDCALDTEWGLHIYPSRTQSGQAE